MLIIELHVAEEFRLPYLPPYLALSKGQTPRHGVNFAVSGATALDKEFFNEPKLRSLLWTNASLSVQIGWFKKLKSSLCTTKQGQNLQTLISYSQLY